MSVQKVKNWFHIVINTYLVVILNQLIFKHFQPTYFSCQDSGSKPLDRDPKLCRYANLSGSSTVSVKFEYWLTFCSTDGTRVQFCHPLPTTVANEDIFGMADSFLQYSSMCTDVAPVIFGARQGFVAKVKEVSQESFDLSLSPQGQTCCFGCLLNGIL